MQGGKEHKRNHYEKKHHHDQKDKEKWKDSNKEKFDFQEYFESFGFHKMLDFLQSDYDRVLKKESVKQIQLLSAIARRIKDLCSSHFEHHKTLMMNFCREVGHPLTEAEYERVTANNQSIWKQFFSIASVQERNDIRMLRVTLRTENPKQSGKVGVFFSQNLPEECRLQMNSKRARKEATEVVQAYIRLDNVLDKLMNN